MNAIDSILRAHGVLVGRMLLGLLFVFSGVGIVLNGITGAESMIASVGFPMAGLLAWVVVIWKVGAGAALMVGYKTKEAALALILFLLVTIVFFHMSLQDINLFKNLSILGGMLYVYVYGPGNGWKLDVGAKSGGSSSSMGSM